MRNHPDKTDSRRERARSYSFRDQQIPQQEDRKNIYLSGFMGTGKTTVGRLLSQLMGFPFFDSDRVVELACGIPFSQAFSNAAAPNLRVAARDFILNGHPERGCVVACGGGISTQWDILSALKGKGRVFYLYASSATIYARLQTQPKRPLLQMENPHAHIRAQLAKQMAGFRDSGICICTEGLTPIDVARRIKHIYHSLQRDAE